MFRRQIILLLVGILLRSPVWGKVFVRWSESTWPTKTLGVAELVIPWDTNTTALIRSAEKYGYRVYVEVPEQQALDAAARTSKEPIAGLIIGRGTALEADAARRKLRTTNPKLTLLALNGNGKQPQMRGQTISSPNGILQISSPTAQPWLDSNLAMVRFEQDFHLEQRPLFSFQWELADSLEQQNGPSVEDYSLAVAEAGAIHADLILNLDGRFEKGLVENQPAAWTTWNQLRSYLNFTSRPPDPALRSWANVGVTTDDYNTAYEPMNLMARHNIPFKVLHTVGLSPRGLEGLSMVAVFTAPDRRAVNTLYNFAGQGGTVILVDLKGKYPWQSAQAVQTAEHAVSYPAGKGRVVELSEPITDPETFAQDVRRLIGKDQVLISAWNALTTIAVPYRDDRTGEIVVELVNYAEEAMRIQVQLKGLFSSIRYESPDRGCCQDLSPVMHDGFTDFVVPSLQIAGRVRLKTASDGKQFHPIRGK